MEIFNVNYLLNFLAARTGFEPAAFTTLKAGCELRLPYPAHTNTLCTFVPPPDYVALYSHTLLFQSQPAYL